MFSPTRTALFLAIGALSFAPGEAAAQTCRVGVTKNCVTSLAGVKTCWCAGSEICAVSALQSYFDDLGFIGPVTSKCTVLGSETTVGGGGGSCPISGTMPSGTLFCDGGEGGGFFSAGFSPAGGSSGAPTGAGQFAPSVAPSPPTLADCALPGSGHIFGFNGVNVSGGSTVGTFGVDNGVVCSNKTVAIAGINTQVNGNAVAGGAVTVTGGADVTGATDSGASPLAVQPTVTPCPAYSSGAGITPASSYNAGTGVLKQLTGGTVALDPLHSPYCFQSVTLSAGSTLEISDKTTIDVRGVVNFSGGSSVFNKTPDAALTINSSVVNSGTTADVTFAGGAGAKVTVYAPKANIKLSTGANYAGSFIGKTVAINGTSVVNNDQPAQFYDEDGNLVEPELTAEAPFTCDVNGTCTAIAEIFPPPGLFCADGGEGEAFDFTASAFVGQVELCGDMGYGIDCAAPLYQLCQQTNSPNGPYQCTDVTAACFD